MSKTSTTPCKARRDVDTAVDTLVAVAAQVAREAEREACARLCLGILDTEEGEAALEKAARLIRARGGSE